MSVWGKVEYLLGKNLLEVFFFFFLLKRQIKNKIIKIIKIKIKKSAPKYLNKLGKMIFLIYTYIYI